MAQSKHIPVLLDEVLSFIEPQAEKNYIDATLGGGGYTEALLKKNGPVGKVMCFDLDNQAISLVQEKLSIWRDRIIYINDNYSTIKSKVDEYKFNKIGGIVCDLGYSSIQIEDWSRGFSFESQGTLDLRYNQQTPLTGDEILNTWREKDIADVLKNYGEEPLAKKIAKTIVWERKKTKITGQMLRQIVERVYGQKWSTPSRINPATRTWQALRIAVNDEFKHLKIFLNQSLAVLPSGSRLAVVSFHSLEDKIVKEFFKQEAKDCICPKEVVKCICQHQVQLKIITKKPVRPTTEEIRSNPRSRSAKLRVIEKK